MPDRLNRSIRRNDRPPVSSLRCHANARALVALLQLNQATENPPSTRRRSGRTGRVVRPGFRQRVAAIVWPSKASRREHAVPHASRAGELWLSEPRGCGREFFRVRSFSLFPPIFERFVCERRQVACLRPRFGRIKGRTFDGVLQWLKDAGDFFPKFHNFGRFAAKAKSLKV